MTDRSEASNQLLHTCQQIALQMMKIHPQAAKLGDPETQSAIIKSAHQLTVELETIKKLVIKLEKRDDSTLT
jgi:hypothetical protein